MQNIGYDLLDFLFREWNLLWDLETVALQILRSRPALGGWRPTHGKSWIRHWACTNVPSSPWCASAVIPHYWKSVRWETIGVIVFYSTCCWLRQLSDCLAVFVLFLGEFWSIKFLETSLFNKVLFWELRKTLTSYMVQWLTSFSQNKTCVSLESVLSRSKRSQLLDCVQFF